MSKNLTFTFYDRTDAKIKTEKVYAHHFLHWSHNNKLGLLTNDILFRQKFISKLFGWFYKQRWSTRKIKSFIRMYNINMDESILHVDDFTSFNDFFTREIDLSQRTIQNNPHICIAPADGRILAYPVVEADTTFQIKRSIFNLRSFLISDSLTEKFNAGSMVISRLYLSDYHHFHFPDSGSPEKASSIKGKYYAVSPYALKNLVPFYTENHRMQTIFNSDHFGQILMVEIGAFTVGSIRQKFIPFEYVNRAAHKGYFEFGGSTIVLLFQKGKIKLDDDLCHNTQNGLETYIKMGDSIGNTKNYYIEAGD
jgi:phosphatidylserine decarboxylase